MALIIEHDAIQGGAATFRGTRILVRLPTCWRKARIKPSCTKITLG